MPRPARTPHELSINARKPQAEIDYWRACFVACTEAWERLNDYERERLSRIDENGVSKIPEIDREWIQKLMGMRDIPEPAMNLHSSGLVPKERTPTAVPLILQRLPTKPPLARNLEGGKLPVREVKT